MDNTLSGPVEVLETLAGWCNEHGIGKAEYERRSATYAAVAELIEAASRAAIAACRGDDFHPGTIRNADLDALRTALANVGSAS